MIKGKKKQVKECVYYGCDNPVDKEASGCGVPCCYDCRNREDDYIQGREEARYDN